MIGVSRDEARRLAVALRADADALRSEQESASARYGLLRASAKLRRRADELDAAADGPMLADAARALSDGPPIEIPWPVMMAAGDPCDGCDDVEQCARLGCVNSTVEP